MGSGPRGQLSGGGSPAVPEVAPADRPAKRTRVAGFRVVMSWPDSQFAPKPPPRGTSRIRLSGFAGFSLIVGGLAVIAVAVLSQQHAPAPALSAAGKVAPAAVKGPSLR